MRPETVLSPGEPTRWSPRNSNPLLTRGFIPNGLIYSALLTSPTGQEVQLRCSTTRPLTVGAYAEALKSEVDVKVRDSKEVCKLRETPMYARDHNRFLQTSVDSAQAAEAIPHLLEAVAADANHPSVSDLNSVADKGDDSNGPTATLETNSAGSAHN